MECRGGLGDSWKGMTARSENMLKHSRNHWRVDTMAVQWWWWN